MNQEQSVEQRIIQAATNVFIHKGYDGAKMRDIAHQANINISMLHYYYRSKEKLFDIAFGLVFERLYGKIFTVIASDMPIEAKIREVVDIYIFTLTKDPKLPTFIFNEVTQHPERMANYTEYKTRILQSISYLEKQIEEQQGNGKKIEMIKFFLDIESMCMYPFLTKALWQRIFDIDDQHFNSMIQSRKEQYIQKILQSLK